MVEERLLFGVRRLEHPSRAARLGTPLVGALAAATCRSFRASMRSIAKTRRRAAADQSGDRSQHSKELSIAVEAPTFLTSSLSNLRK